MLSLASTPQEVNVLALSTGPDNRVAWVGKTVHNDGTLCTAKVGVSE
jgi:hypothetical protein